MSYRISGGRHVAAALLACAALAACGHNDVKEANPLDGVRTISIDPHIVMPPKIQYFTAGQAWAGALGGVVGAALAVALSPADSVRYRLKQNNVDMSAILLDETRAALARQTRFQIADHDADAVLSLSVDEYGFKTASAFSSNMKVNLHLKTQVTDKTGKVVFEDTDGEWSDKNTYHSMDEFWADTTLLLAAFHDVARQVAVNQEESLLQSAGIEQGTSTASANAAAGGAAATSMHPVPAATSMPATGTGAPASAP